MSGDADSLRFLAGLLETAWPKHAESRAAKLLAAFGSVPAVLDASEEELRRCLGGADGGIAAFLSSVGATAGGPARDEAERPLLLGAEALIDFLGRGASPAGALRVLFLNARNLLLADETFAGDLPPAGALTAGPILRRALELSATALILVGRRDSAEPTPGDLRETARFVRAARTLDIVVHDRILASPQGLRSFRQSGLLS